MKLEEVSCLFITNKTGFDTNFIQYHEELHYRGFLSATAVLQATKSCLVRNFKRNARQLLEYYNDARFLRLVMMELPEEQIEIGFETNDHIVQKYDELVHKVHFPPLDPLTVTEISGDGNEKVLVKLCQELAPKKRSGQSSKNKNSPKPYMNG